MCPLEGCESTLLFIYLLIPADNLPDLFAQVYHNTLFFSDQCSFLFLISHGISRLFHAISDNILVRTPQKCSRDFSIFFHILNRTYTYILFPSISTSGFSNVTNFLFPHLLHLQYHVSSTQERSVCCHDDSNRTFSHSCLQKIRLNNFFINISLLLFY